MKYTGRLLSLVLVLLFEAVWAVHAYLKFGPSGVTGSSGMTFETGFSLATLLAAWCLGWRYDRVKFDSEMDILTEVYNRRFAEQIFPKLVGLSDRRLEKLSILMVDTDHLKRINDTYGHQLGDAAIWHVSDILLRNTRKTDVVARFGGDEFIVIAPYTGEHAARDIAERIHQSLEMEPSDLPVQVTVSTGVAVYPDDGRTLQGLLQVADERMYQYKRVGRQQA